MGNVELQMKTKPQQAIKYNQNFLWFLFGRSLSVVGTSVFDFVLSLYVLDLTGSVTAFSTILALAILPQAAVNMFGGVFVDKYNKKKIMIFAEVSSALISILFLFLFLQNLQSIFIISVLVILLNAFQSLFWLAGNSSIPNIVGEERVAKANASLEGIWAVMNILGPVIGAIIYNKLGMVMIFSLSSITFLIGALSVIFIIFDSKSHGERQAEESYWSDLKAVFIFINDQKILKLLLFVAVLINFIYNPLLYLGIPYIAYDVMNVSAIQLSLIRGAAAVGTILGALYVFRLKSGHVMFKKFFILLQIQAFIIICWSFPSFPMFKESSTFLITGVFIVLLGLISMLNTVQNIPILGYFQIEIPEDLRARVFGMLKTALLISTPIGIWFYGLIFKYIPWTYVVIVSGAVIVILCLILSRNPVFTSFIRNIDKK
ncbi:MFS transporter [Paenibacillus polysaccharolyticus]|uniref:MFS transporter n=1 Tax=Paenibacillus TaxID=44249 RepID=UPI0012B75563|nr:MULTISPECIES: MFS transporter [Paenibacillus]MCP1135855.1 MFS transporter [Paenibacillus polysaccharolyticus]